MHTGKNCVSDLDRQEFVQAILDFKNHPDLLRFFGSRERYHEFIKGSGTHLHLLQAALYHLGRATTPPQKRGVPSKFKQVIKPRMNEVLVRYLATRSLTDRPSTVVKLDLAIRGLGVWLACHYPQIDSFAQVSRPHVLEYIQAIQTLPNQLNGQPLSVYTKKDRINCLAVFFREVAEWHWEGVPNRPLLGRSDLPKMPQRVPRYIPEEELGRLMTAIRALSCPYQRAALLIARWSGARKDEIRRLSFDCLDTYPDGTSRLRIPVGKTKKERLIPLHEEAAAAIRAIRAGRGEERGLPDNYTGIETRYLFLHHGKLYSTYYLFYTALQQTCKVAGLVDSQDRATVSAHRFRHTVGTQLAEKGAKLSTIMSVLGHASASMSMVYAQISDREVLRDYQAVLGPGANLAGPAALLLQNGELKGVEINWLQTNFFKTELELGHCLRLPQEGPCECDLYLNCTKFVTTSEYIPRLRQRRQLELELIKDANSQGWQREVERHTCAVRRLEQLLTELGEVVEIVTP
jgi:integrase